MFQSSQVVHDRYQLQQQLGNNAGRQTWLAEDLQATGDDRQVVVKFLIFSGSTQWDELKLFERESMILQQLSHPYIPQYRDSFSIDVPLPWMALVQSYIPGGSLKQHLDQGQRFSESELIAIARAILTILNYLHRLSPPVLHRDIKPSNIILGTDNQVYLVDFGAVQDRAAQAGATFTVVGTYGYAPMEQFGGRTVPASDLYALGATIVNLATGVAPGEFFGEDGRLHIRDRLSLRPKLIDWLCRMTEPLASDRFPTAQLALDALSSLEAQPVLATASSDTLAVVATQPPMPNPPVALDDSDVPTVWGEPGRYTLAETSEYLMFSTRVGGVIRWCFGRLGENPDHVTTAEMRTLLIAIGVLILLVPFIATLLVGAGWAFFPYALAGGCMIAMILALNVGHSKQLRFERQQFHMTYRLFHWIYQHQQDWTQQITGVFLSQRKTDQGYINILCIRMYNNRLYQFSDSALQEDDYHWLVQKINDWLHQD